uniref:WD40 repeat domain-containing protein n=1 Tax=Nonomuraea sp. SBT364 TaxID=1580530 RepID=UPI00066ED59F
AAALRHELAGELRDAGLVPPDEGEGDEGGDGGPAVVPAPGLAGPPALGEVAERVYGTLTERQRAELPGLLLTLLEGGPAQDEHGTLARLEDAGLLVRPSLRVPPVETPVGTLVAIGGDGIVPASAALYRAWPRLRTWVTRRHHPRTPVPAPHPATPGHLPAAGRRPAGRRGRPLEERLRKGAVVALAAAVVLLGVAMVTVKAGPELTRQENARLVAARAEALRGEDPQAAMRLSVAAWRLAPVREARDALRASLSQEELGVFSDPVPTRGARYRLSGDSLVRWEGDAVTAWDVPTGRRLATHPLPPATTGLSDDGRYAETAGGTPVAVATGTATNATFLVSVGERTELYSGGGRLLEVTGGRVALSPDGRRAAVSRPDGRVELWDVPKRALKRAIRVAPEDGAAPLAFSPDGRLLAVAGPKTYLIGASTTTAMDPADDGAPGGLGTPGGDAPVFSPDGRVLAVPAGDAVRLWRVGDGRLLKSVALQAPGNSYAFSADGRALHYLSGHGTVISLDVAATDPVRADAVREVCAKAGGLSEDEWRRLIPETGYRKVC